MRVRKNANYFISMWKTLNLSLEYFNMRIKQCGKKSLNFRSLKDSVSHDSLKLPIQYARFKRCFWWFQMFWRFFPSLEKHKKWKKKHYFPFPVPWAMDRTNVTHPERRPFRLADFAHNGKVETFSFWCRVYTKKKIE